MTNQVKSPAEDTTGDIAIIIIAFLMLLVAFFFGKIDEWMTWLLVVLSVGVGLVGVIKLLIARRAAHK